jgi:hypothetical protein
VVIGLRGSLDIVRPFDLLLVIIHWVRERGELGGKALGLFIYHTVFLLAIRILGTVSFSWLSLKGVDLCV